MAAAGKLEEFRHRLGHNLAKAINRGDFLFGGFQQGIHSGKPGSQELSSLGPNVGNSQCKD